MPKNVVVQHFRNGMYEYKKILINCGKACCRKCPHGPYWYVHWQDGEGTNRRKYIGKELVLIQSRKEFLKGLEPATR